MTNNTQRRFKSCAQGYQELVHAYAYASMNESGRTSCDRMSYEGGKVYSYSTVIAFKDYTQTEDTEYKAILFITNDRHSNTTAKQKKLLLGATSHFHHIYINSHRYNGGINTSDITKSAEDYVKSLREMITENKLTKKSDYEAFIFKYEQLHAINQLYSREYTADLLEFAPVYQQLISGDVANFKKEAKQKQAAERARIKEELKDFISKNTYSECAAFAYNGDTFCKDDAKIKTMLKTLLSNNNKYSVIWFSGDSLKTSQGVTIEKTEAVVLMKLWKRGKLQHGATVAGGKYTVISSTAQGVRVGCHKISAENIEELLKEV